METLATAHRYQPEVAGSNRPATAIHRQQPAQSGLRAGIAPGIPIVCLVLILEELLVAIRTNLSAAGYRFAAKRTLDAGAASHCKSHEETLKERRE
jgi:hypothetical protein